MSFFSNNNSSSTNNNSTNQPGIFTSSSPSLPPLPPVSTSLFESRIYPMSSSSTSLLPSSTSMSSHLYQPYTTSRPKSNLYSQPGYNYPKLLSRPRLTTILWEDESTICYQVDCRGICVARRQGRFAIFTNQENNVLTYV